MENYNKEQLKQAVLDNLPKSTICPKHNCQMEVMSGVSKKGEPYRAYKCGISKCDQIIWTDREAGEINAEVQDINTILGIEVNKHPAEKYQDKIANNVEKATNRKENSIVEAAIRRDAVMFAVAEFGGYIGDELRESRLKELHSKWLLYFETEYKGENQNGN